METYNRPIISVVAPVNEAIEKTRILLFSPFNLEKWFVIGFCAWLANLLREGVRGAFNFRFPNSRHEVSQHWLKFVEFVKENIVIVSIVGAIVIILVLTVILVLLWLNSRGQFMFIDCLAKNKAQIAEPWKTFQKEANSLFKFRLVIIFASYLLITAFSIPVALLAYAIKSEILHLAAGIAAVCAAVLLIIVLALIFAVVQIITLDFAAAIMYRNRINATEAWRKFLSVLKNHFGKIILYLLFRIVLYAAVSVIIFTITLFGCCCLCGAGLILLLPYIGTVAFLPFLSFLRLYSLCFLRQFGNEFDVFV